MFNFKKGMSLLEILVAIAIVGILLLVILPQFSKMRENQTLQSAVVDVVSAIERARSMSISSIDSSSYGVHFESDKVVIFKGITYSAVDPLNEDINIISPATISDILFGVSDVDVYFSRLLGEPNATGFVKITTESFSKTINLSATGTVSVE